MKKFGLEINSNKTIYNYGSYREKRRKELGMSLINQKETKSLKKRGKEINGKDRKEKYCEVSLLGTQKMAGREEET